MRVQFVRLQQKNINISLSVDRILIIYNTESSLTAVVSRYHAGVLHCCRSAGAHSRLLFARALAQEGSWELRAPLGSGKPSLFER